MGGRGGGSTGGAGVVRIESVACRALATHGGVEIIPVINLSLRVIETC